MSHKDTTFTGRKLFIYGIFTGFCLFFILPLGSYVIIDTYSDKLLSVDQASTQLPSESYKVAIVFGGGVRNGKPLPLLKERLNTAKTLIDSKSITKIIVSGDNRYLDYNEPQVMFDYLVENGVNESDIQLDNAGRSTYETCERASKIFGLQHAVLISESTHLPRAKFLCKKFGIDALGVYSDGETAKNLRLSQTWREVLARTKAMINVYLIGEKTVLGDPISIE